MTDTPLTLFRSQLGILLSADATELSETDRLEMVKSAVEQYTQDKPDTRTEDVPGDGGRYYILQTILDLWSEGFSHVTKIEYPAADVSTDETPVHLEDDDYVDNYWAEVAGEQTRHLYMHAHAPAATEEMRITYTLPWQWAAAATTTDVAQAAHGLAVDDYIYLVGSTWTLATDFRQATGRVTAVADDGNFTYGDLVLNAPVQDFFAICHLAACYSCRAIATKYASATDTTITADSTAHTSRSAEFANRAEDYCSLYLRHMGLLPDAKTIQATSQFVQWETSPNWPASRQYIFHRS